MCGTPSSTVHVCAIVTRACEPREGIAVLERYIGGPALVGRVVNQDKHARVSSGLGVEEALESKGPSRSAIFVGRILRCSVRSCICNLLGFPLHSSGS